MKIVKATSDGFWSPRDRAGSTIYYAESSFDEKDAVKRAGFWWSPMKRKWWTPKIDCAMQLAEWADSSCREELMNERMGRIKSAELSRQTSSEFQPPVPDGLSYFPFQRAGIEYALSRENALIGDEMGIGKTIQAIGVVNQAHPESVLVICPASLKLNWRNELRKWLVHDYSIGIANGAWPDSQVVIINYDILKKYRTELRARTWGAMIVDECHALKNGKAQRTGEVFGRRADNKKDKPAVPPIPAERKLFLSGTPMLNRPSELWTIVHALDPKTWGSWMYYHKRYCNAHQDRFGWDTSGASNLPELQQKLRETIMIRRLKKDVLTELPAKIRQVVEFDSTPFQSVLQAERDASDLLAETRQRLLAAVEIAKASDDETEYREAVKALTEHNAVEFSEMARVRHETAKAKIPLVIEHLKNVLESQDKIIVFAHHKTVIRAIKEEFGKHAVVLVGDTKQGDRQEAVERFQGDPDCRLFIGSIQAAGVGITLTAASTVIFAELDWVPGNMSQAEDRAHRIGQKESVLIQILVLEGSLDALMARKIIAKQEVIEKAMDKEIEIEPITIPEKKITVTREQLSYESLSLTGDQVEAIHSGLQYLAMTCDGARRQDGHGFSKVDTRIGHELAKLFRLSPKQAALGKRLCTKYQRQLSPELIERIKGNEIESVCDTSQY